MRTVDQHLHALLERSPEAKLEYARLFAELPLQTQLAIMRRQRLLSQRGLALKLKVRQPQVARTESPRHNPRLSTLMKAARAIRCRLVVIPDEDLARLAA